MLLVGGFSRFSLRLTRLVAAASTCLPTVWVVRRFVLTPVPSATTPSDWPEPAPVHDRTSRRSWGAGGRSFVTASRCGDHYEMSNCPVYNQIVWRASPSSATPESLPDPVTDS